MNIHESAEVTREEFKKNTQHKRLKSLTNIGLVAPALSIYLTFSLWPLLNTFRLSLYQTTDSGDRKWVGINQYIELFGNPIWSDQFFNALTNNLQFFGIHVVVQNSIALFLAGLLALVSSRASTFYRGIFFIPTLISVVVVGFVWQLILSPIWGITPNLFDSLGLDHLFAPWLGLESSALITVGLISVWQNVGLPLLLFYSALIAIPQELIEASRLDGLGKWACFWRIKVPLILPTIGVVNILTFIGNFTLSFDLIYAIQGGLAGPSFSTDVMSTFLFRTFFGFQTQLGDHGMGATIATCTFLLILFVVGMYLLLIQRRLRIH